MTNEEYEIHLKKLIRNYEERYINYKKTLEDVFKDRINYPVKVDEYIKVLNCTIADHLKHEDEIKVIAEKTIENVNWYKQFLREEKNENEKELKHLQEELYNFRQGLNPPFCYKTTQFGIEFVNF